MKRYLAASLCFLILLTAILGPFTRAMRNKPYAEKLGLIPHPKVLKALFPDYQELVAASILGRVILYYGSISQEKNDPREVLRSADYPAMSRAIHAALRLDPYNMDGYYFGQAILVWDVGQYKLAAELLEYGMHFRNWDYQLPFFAGFDYAYFLGDKKKAAEMYMRAGKLSGSALFEKLAGRYLQEAGQTRMAIDYLQALAASARKPAIKKTLETRIEAFKAVRMIEKARDHYKRDKGRDPDDIAALLKRGYLTSIPVDPYGGRFYLDQNHQVRTTSKFAFATLHKHSPPGKSSSRPSKP